jgi:tRNA pseudouridine55 synthase
VRPCGLLNLNKPGGMTSRDAVDVVQRLLPRRTKIGHAGTLDPLASGVLVLCVGAATRLIGHVQRMPKRYTGAFLLGRRSPTEDVEGDVTELEDPPVPTPEAFAAAARALVGVIQQRPPAYSALKVQGRRAYDVARRGGDVDLKPRPVTVYRLDVRRYEYPEVTLDVECGAGTYIRSLGRDLAESLGTAAVMSGLVRTAIGEFSIDRAVGPEQLDRATLAEHLLPAILAVPTLPRVVLSAEEMTEIGHGRNIRPRPELPEAPEYAALDPAGRLTAILVPRSTGLGPLHNLSASD